MVAAGSVLVLLGVLAIVAGTVVLARRQARARPWPQLAVLIGLVVLLVGLLARSSGRHQDVCTYPSHRCAVPTRSAGP